MKKNSLQKLLAMALASVMVMGTMTGCGEEKAPAATTPESTKAETSVAESTAPVSDAQGMEGWEAFTDKVSITVPVYDRGKEGYPAVDDNYWTQWVQKEFGDKWNIDIKFVAIPRADVMTKYSMLIAAKDTPTILMEYDYPKVAQWANDGAMQPINLDEFAKVAPTYYNRMVELGQLQYTEISGDTYFVLAERPYYNTTYTFVNFCRMDWLKQVGYDKVPETYQDWMDATQKIMDAGLTDEAPLELMLPSSGYVPNFNYRDFPVDEAEWAQHSSLGVPSFSWNATKAYIQRLNEQYNNGYIPKEFDLDIQKTDGTQAEANFINGKSLYHGGYMSADVTWLKSFYEKNPDAELAIVSNYKDVDGEACKVAQVRADNPFGMIIGFSSLADENQLKAAWMYMEWMTQPETLYTMQYGVEGTNYTIGDDGYPVMINLEGTGTAEMLNNLDNKDMWCVTVEAKTRDTIEDSIKAITPQGIPQDFSQAMIDNYNELKNIADKGQAYSDPVFAVIIDSESEYSKSLLSLYQEYFAKLIKCKPEEFEANYEKFSKEYLEAGYQEIIDERLEAYEAGNTTKLPEGSK